MPTRSLSPHLRPFGPHTYTKMKVEYPPVHSFSYLFLYHFKEYIGLKTLVVNEFLFVCYTTCVNVYSRPYSSVTLAFVRFWPDNMVLDHMVQDHNGPGPKGPYGPGLLIVLKNILSQICSGTIFEIRTSPGACLLYVGSWMEQC